MSAASHPDPYEIEELRAAEAFERRYQRLLNKFPSCDDPDHPGCDYCDEEAEDDEQDDCDDDE